MISCVLCWLHAETSSHESRYYYPYMLRMVWNILSLNQEFLSVHLKTQYFLVEKEFNKMAKMH